MFYVGAILRWAVLVGYLAGTFLYVGRLVSSRFRQPRLATSVLVLTTVLHALLVVQMGMEFDGLTFVTTTLQAATLYAMGVAATTLLIETSTRNRSFGAFGLPLALVLFALSLVQRPVHTAVDPRFDSYWFEIHVSMAVVGYTAFGLAFVAGLMYVVLAGAIQRRDLGQLFSRMPSLESLDQLGHRAVVFGLVFFTLAIISGAGWSHDDTGRWFSGQAKELMSFVTWGIFALQLLMRWRAGWRGRRSALMNILGFASMVGTFFGGGSARPHL